MPSSWASLADGGDRIVGVAASWGGLGAFRQILATLPADFPAPIVLLQHLSPQSPSHLVELLRNRTHLRVKQVEHGDRLRPGMVFTPVPGRHVSIDEDRRLALSDGAKVQFARPSADVFYESMAVHFGPKSVAVILTGKGSDGAKGVVAVRRSGGFVIAQDERTSDHFDMPYAAILTRKVDLVLPVDQIGFALAALIQSQEPAAIA